MPEGDVALLLVELVTLLGIDDDEEEEDVAVVVCHSISFM